MNVVQELQKVKELLMTNDQDDRLTVLFKINEKINIINSLISSLSTAYTVDKAVTSSLDELIDVSSFLDDELSSLMDFILSLIPPSFFSSSSESLDR